MEEEIIIDNIIYIFHDSLTLKVTYANGKCAENVCSYYALLKILDENFMRINANTIINFNYVKRCNDKTVTMDDNTVLKIEPKYEKTVVNRFFKARFEKFNSGNNKK